MARADMRKQRSNGDYAPVRSVRVEDELWTKAQRRAAYEGVTMSNVLYAIVEGWAAGLIDLPVTKVVYKQPRTPASVPAAGKESGVA